MAVSAISSLVPVRIPNDRTGVTLPDANSHDGNRPGPNASFAPVQKSVDELSLVRNSLGRLEANVERVLQ